jgi:hypothetical protein
MHLPLHNHPSHRLIEVSYPFRWMGRAMQDSGNTNPRTAMVMGLLSMAVGMIPLLAMMGVLPHGQAPSDPAPSWMGWLIGLMFVAAGILLIIRSFTGADADGALPATGNRLLRGFYELLSLGIVCSLGALFTWVAFGPGPRHFSVSAGGFAMSTSGGGDMVGRIAFGFGSVLTWCALGAFLLAAVRRWRR